MMLGSLPITPLTTVLQTLGTPRATSGPPDSHEPLPLASSKTLLNAHRLPWGSLGSLLSPAAWARMKVKLSIIHGLAPPHFPCLAGCKYYTVSGGQRWPSRLPGWGSREPHPFPEAPGPANHTQREWRGCLELLTGLTLRDREAALRPSSTLSSSSPPVLLDSPLCQASHLTSRASSLDCLLPRQLAKPF